MRIAFAMVVLVACGSPRTSERVPEEKPVTKPPAGCTVGFDSTRGTITVDGALLADLRIETLRAVLGAPDRVERVERVGHYEESGETPSDRWTSTRYTATDHYYVYDRRGLVFHTRNGMHEKHTDPERMLVFLASPRVFDHTEAPRVMPASRGGCTLVINGTRVDPNVDLRPRGVTYETQSVPLFGTTFGPTSFTTIIDSLYTLDGPRRLTIYLDAAATGRPSYAEL